MKPLRIFLLSAMLILAASALGQGTKTDAVATAPQAQASQAAPTLASAIDREISAVEKQVLDAAEAMPEDKFNFSPESLHLPGGQLHWSADVCRAGQAHRGIQLFHLVRAHWR